MQMIIIIRVQVFRFNSMKSCDSKFAFCLQIAYSYLSNYFSGNIPSYPLKTIFLAISVNGIILPDDRADLDLS